MDKTMKLPFKGTACHFSGTSFIELLRRAFFLAIYLYNLFIRKNILLYLKFWEAHLFLKINLSASFLAFSLLF